MDNAVIIIVLAALFCLGFIPVAKLSKFVRRNHRYITEDPSRSGADKTGEGDGPLDEFENSGVLYLGPEGDAAKNTRDLPGDFD